MVAGTVCCLCRVVEGDGGMIEGYMPKQDVVDMLLELRYYATIDMSCFQSEAAKAGLADIISQIDSKMKEITK